MKIWTVALLGLGFTTAVVAAPLVSGIDRSHWDTNVRLQDDLYMAVNGHWLATTEIPADKSNYGAFGALDDLSRDRMQALIRELAAKKHADGSDAQKIADVYHSYMAEDVVKARGLQPLEKDLAQIATIKTPVDVARQFAAASLIGVGAPLSVSVPVDAKKSDQYLPSLSQSGLTLPDRDYYLSDEQRYQDARAAYLVHAEKLFVLSGASDETARAGARRILELETEIARAQWPRVELRNPEKNYNKTSAAALSEVAPGFPWKEYFQSLGISPVEVNVNQPPFVKAVAGLLTSTPVEVWRDYFRFKLLDGFALLLPPEFEHSHFELHAKKLAGIPVPRTREVRAIEAIGGAGAGDFGVVGDLVGKLYVEKHFTPEAKARMDALVKNLLLAYAQSLEELTWMSPETKARAREKLSKYTVKIGYPERWRDYSTLVIRADDLVGNFKASARHKLQRQLDRIGKPVDRTEWAMTPQTVNAYYSPTRNEIVFPAAILQPPCFDVTADDAVNYGAIGAVIGHEISHGFDDQGSKYDGDGNLNNWWTDADRAAFKARTQHLVEQYSAYEPLPGRKLNGTLTLGENIADLSGQAIALKAYRLSLGGKPAPVIDGLTGEQRFFIGWAQAWKRKFREAEAARRLLTDVHSPSHFRSNGASMNQDAFHEAFGTKPGDGMYKAPEKRIRIW